MTILPDTASWSADDVTFCRTMLSNSAAIAGLGVGAFGLTGGITPQAATLGVLAAGVGAMALSGSFVFKAFNTYLDERAHTEETAEQIFQADEAAEHAAYQAILLAYESGALARYRDGDWLVHRKGAVGFELMTQGQYDQFSAELARRNEDLLVLDVSQSAASLPDSFTLVRHRTNESGQVEREEVLRVLHGEKVAVQPVEPGTAKPRRAYARISFTA